MGRSPCCDKVGLKKGPWTPEEDQKLLSYIEEHGHGSWRALPGKAGLQRCGKSCRLRWTNYLRPDIKRGKFSIQEEQIIIQLHALLGNRWSAIATHLPKRTDNEIKNYWNTHLKKHLTKLGIDPVTHKPKSDTLSTADGHSRTAANLNHMAQWESARLEAEARLVRESKLRPTPQPATCPHIAMSSSPSLEALRSWQCVWSKPNVDHESPTSTLSFSENNIQNQNTMISSTMETTEEDDEGNNWIKCYKKEAGLSFSLDETTAIFSSEEATSWLAGMMIGGGPDEQNSSDNVGGSCVDVEDGDGDGGGGEEENKEYWNSILNLVNSTSPPNSPPPVF